MSISDRHDMKQELHQLEERLKAFRVSYNKVGLVKILGEIAELQHSLGNDGTALELLKEQEGVLETLHNIDNLNICFCKQAILYHKLGDESSAIAIYKRLENSCEIDTINFLYTNHSLNMLEMGMLDEGLSVNTRLEKISKKKGNVQGQVVSLMNHALFLINYLGENKKAHEVAQKALKLAKVHNMTDFVERMEAEIARMW